MIEKFDHWLKDNSITEVECLVPDLGGIARGKILPSNKFIKGLKDDNHRLPQSIFIINGFMPNVYTPIHRLFQ